MLSPSGGEIERGLASARLSTGGDDLPIFEQPEFFSDLLSETKDFLGYNLAAKRTM